MHCNPGEYTILDNEETLTNIHTFNGKMITWYIMKTGYVGAHVMLNDKQTNLCLHQLLMNHHGHGKGQASVDHINGNKLDNRLANLRIVDQSVQNTNRGKVARHKTARELPDALKGITFPKFVVYYKESVNGTEREFFTVEGHPVQRDKENGVVNNATAQLTSRRWATTKSAKFSITEKFNQAVAYIRELDKLAENNTYNLCIPVLVYEKPAKPVKTATPKVSPVKEKKTKVPKQWKVKQVYDSIVAKSCDPYKEWCATTNELTHEELNGPFTDLIHNVNDAGSLKNAEPIIRDFIENLRRLRHNKLSTKKNEANNPIDRPNRQQWPAASVLKLYVENKMNIFKVWLDSEDNTADCSDATKRWDKLCKDIADADDDSARLSVISKFMTARRARKYRACA